MGQAVLQRLPLQQSLYPFSLPFSGAKTQQQESVVQRSRLQSPDPSKTLLRGHIQKGNIWVCLPQDGDALPGATTHALPAPLLCSFLNTSAPHRVSGPAAMGDGSASQCCDGACRQHAPRPRPTGCGTFSLGRGRPSSNSGQGENKLETDRTPASWEIKTIISWIKEKSNQQ